MQSKTSLIIYVLNSKSKFGSILYLVVVLPEFLNALPSNYLDNKLPNHLSKMGIHPLKKNTYCLQLGCQNPQPGPFPIS
jgi:hypothetical protein